MGEPLVVMAARLRNEAAERSQLERVIAEHTDIPPSVKAFVKNWTSAWDDIRQLGGGESPPAVAVEGCTEEEIRQIAEAQHTPLPVHYVEFLSVMGRSAGNLWSGSVWLYPDLLRLKDSLRDELVRLGQPFVVRGA